MKTFKSVTLLQSLIIAGIMCIFFSDCKKKEVTPGTGTVVTPATPYNPNGGGTPQAPEQKNRALLMDFTETWCTPCGYVGGPSFDTTLQAFEGTLLSGLTISGTSTPAAMNSAISAGWKSAYDSSGGVPQFMVNYNLEFPGGDGIFTNHSDSYNWAQSIGNAFAAQPVIAGIAISKTISVGKITANATVKFFSAQAAGTDYRLAVYVVEDHVIEPQSDYPAQVTNYEHRNVLRAGNTGDYTGDKLNSSAAITSNQNFTKTYSFTIDNAWTSSNLKLIAVIWAVPATGKATVVNSNTAM